NQQYIKQMSIEEFVEVSRPFLSDLPTEKYDLKKVMALEKDRINTLQELPEVLKFVFILPKYESDLLIWKKSNTEDTKKILVQFKDFLVNFNDKEWLKENLETKSIDWIKNNNLTNGEVLWPVRVALSGQKNSPGPFEIAEVLGRKETLHRIKYATDILNEKL
ncbi:MAG: hypothetical protein ABIJ80_02130, partial [Patescibacteria group bacterium]